LGYDDAAFYYFASCLLGIIVVPWTLSFIYGTLFSSGKDDKDTPGKSKAGSKFRYCQTSTMVEKDAAAIKQTSASRFNKGWLLQLIILGSIWAGLVVVVGQLGQESEIKSFDPFAILEVPTSATTQEIKKAWRRLSMQYHPDKNSGDPLAAARFIQITKAYSALTDEVAKANYEKFGNPDGPQTSKVGIGLPKFLLDKDHSALILCLFFFFLLFFVPMIAICYYQRTKNYAANGVLIETLQFLEYYINEGTRVKNCPELLAASAESRSMPTRIDDEKPMKALSVQIVEHKKRQWPNHPVITRNSFLLWAHMQRLHKLLTPELRSDVDQLLKHSLKITQAMIELSCYRDWFLTAQSVLEFRRCLIQALDVKSSQLLQIPHFDEDTVRQCEKKKKNAVTSLEAFIRKDPEQRQGLVQLEPQHAADVEAFVSHVSDVDLQARIEVEDEAEIVVGDVATVYVQLTRTNLRDDEAVGPVHAPLFPETKFEEWWLFLVESASASSVASKIIAFERIRDTDKVVQAKMQFQVSKAGKRRVELHALCDSYAGVDRKVELNFSVLEEGKANRQIFIHKDDEDLDLVPTLFEQMMGTINQDDEESEDEKQDGAEQSQEKVKSKTKPKKQKAEASAVDDDKAVADDDSSTNRGKDDEGGESSDSSSESD